MGVPITAEFVLVFIPGLRHVRTFIHMLTGQRHTTKVSFDTTRVFQVVVSVLVFVTTEPFTCKLVALTKFR